jgi:gliding motility-associated-like protein
VTDANGCTMAGELTIEDHVLVANELALPNVVSPNGDGKNEVWRPFLITDPDLDITPRFEQYDLTILNRWGQVVHTSTEGGQRFWNPRDVRDGTYFYSIAYRLECGTVLDEHHTGSITVMH